jgi:hypothetical protein
VFSDELKILIDKAKSLKGKFGDVESYEKMFVYIRHITRKEFNMKIEETIGLIKQISRIILFEFGKYPEDVNLKRPPKLPKSSVRHETKALKENIVLYLDICESFKSAVAGYSIFARQRERKALEYHQVERLFQFMARARLSISELLEENCFFEKYMKDKSKWIASTLPFFKEVLSVKGGTANDLLKSSKSLKNLEEMGTNLPNDLKREIIFTMTNPDLNKRPVKNERLNQNEFIEQILQKNKRRTQRQVEGYASHSQVQLNKVMDNLHIVNMKMQLT